jgi:hypothetical protein
VTCPCDEFVFPRPLVITAGLTRLPRALGAFPEWRTAVLAAIGAQPRLDDWRARDPEDLGLMLAEMGAYVFDVVSFYDALIANESYLRTALLPGSQRRHVALLGYLPRPAVGAEALLAAEAEGRALLALPAGTAFRSGEFDGNPPQVFELTQDASVEPRINRLAVSRVRETLLPVSFNSLLVQPGSRRVRAGDAVAFDFGGTLQATRIAAITEVSLRSKIPAASVSFTSTVTPPAATSYAQTRLLEGGATAGLWKLGSQADETSVLDDDTLLLESRLPLRAGDVVLLEHGTTLLAHRVVSATDELRTVLTGLTSTITDEDDNESTLVSPDIKVTVTRITLDAVPTWFTIDVDQVVVHYACSDGAILLPAIKDTLEQGDAVIMPAFIDEPRNQVAELLLEDVHGEGVATTGTLDVATHSASLDTVLDWGKSLTAPVNLFGNTLHVSRGESVRGEILGTGDGALAEQIFTLRKKPLTYLNAATASGRASTLRVWVDGIEWHEAENFFGASDTDRIFIVRHDEEGNTDVTFGGGARLTTGAAVIADYRFGAGSAVPPAASIRQVAKPVARLRGVRNVLPAFGGSDAESAAELSIFAPRSALLLGRAISLVDLEVVATQVGGVRAARAAWRWDEAGLRPAAIVSYIGDEQLAPTILGALRAVSEPDAPIGVQRSAPQAASMQVGVSIDTDYVSTDVVAAVLEVLFGAVTLPGTGGLLRAERLGPDGVLFQSHVVYAVMNVPGVTGIEYIGMDGSAFSEGRAPAAGAHYDFSLGGVTVNGVSA